jgi:hypothetical protein
VFFKKTKSDHCIKLIPTPLSRELNEEDKTGQTTIFARNGHFWQQLTNILWQELRHVLTNML